MATIQKFSLTYVIAEDRLAWDTEDDAGDTTRLWLTQRLCRGLVTALLKMLKTQAPEAPARAAPATAPQREAAVQSFEQAAAMSQFGKTPGVRARPEAVSGLVRAVHIRPFPDRMDLTFEFGADGTRTIGVPHTGLRQMLGVMHRLHAAAGWPLDIWPGWITDPTVQVPSGVVN